ncbi:MAG: DUF5320 domain-containing protein [Candidatus Gastranaerophilales bacterium]|nr:DUF5320 domain-containing protein [Candidatus Gastranaerophilales bacterium]
MPNLNGTGPMGQGPMTGRGLGNCQGADRGFGFRRFRGRGFGLGAGRFLGFTQKESLADLKAIEAQMVADLDNLRKEIAETNEKE